MKITSTYWEIRENQSEKILGKKKLKLQINKQKKIFTAATA